MINNKRRLMKRRYANDYANDDVTWWTGIQTSNHSKKKKKSKMNDNAFRDRENWTNLQLRPKNIQHLILFLVIFFIYCWKQSAPPILTAQRRIGMWMTALLHINADWEFTCAKRLVLHTYIHNSCTWLYIYVSLSHWYYVGLQEWAIENFFCIIVICMHL